MTGINFSNHIFVFFNLFILIGGYLFSDIVLVSAIHQCEPATVDLCPLLLNLPLEPPSHLPPLWVVTEHQIWVPASYSKFPLVLYFTDGNVCFHTLNSSHPVLPHCVHNSVHHVLLHCCPAYRFISNIFLESICMH